MAVIAALCIFLTRGMQVHARTKRQVIAEFIVAKVNDLVKSNMGSKFSHYGPFVAAILALSAGCSLTSLVGMYAPTSDLSAVLGWSLLVFVMITATKIRSHGFGGYLKGFAQPIAVMTPMNIISEVSTPVSMAFRHFGNIASGSVIMTLVYAALAYLSNIVFRLLPGMLGELLGQIPLFQVGIPAILSLYFDLFSSILQAFIFCMLTMIYIKTAADD